jgi:hypothetical protein
MDNEHLARPEFAREGRRAVDDEMWEMPEEQPVLAACRLAFSGVDHDDRPTPSLRHGAQLARGWEARASTTRQAAGV